MARHNYFENKFLNEVHKLQFRNAIKNMETEWNNIPVPLLTTIHTFKTAILEV